MPFGCFGKRRKREKTDDQLKAAGGDNKESKNNVGGDATTKLAGTDEADVSEVIAVARSHSLHASAPNSVEHRHTTLGIQKSATLARYDFMRKSEYANTADRWIALKQQYLTQQQQQQHGAQNGAAGGVKRAAQSLPRQFAPPSSVRFSQWFYERQTMEADARREYHEREEKTRKLLDGLNNASIAEEQASDGVGKEANGRQEAGLKVVNDSGSQGNGGEAETHPTDEPAADSQDTTKPDQADVTDRLQNSTTDHQETEADSNDDDADAADGSGTYDGQKRKPTIFEMMAAATKIQANYKGYRIRKILGKLPSQQQSHEQDDEEAA